MTDLITPNFTRLRTGANATVADIHLASTLGYQRVAPIRMLIRRNLSVLKTMGPVCHRSVPAISGRGHSSAVTEYHLNPAQAAFIIAKSRAKHADILATMMPEVFAMLSDGDLGHYREQSASELEGLSAANENVAA